MIKIRWTKIHVINVRRFAREIGCSSMRATSLGKKKEKLSPAQKELCEIFAYIKPLHHPIGPSTPPLSSILGSLYLWAHTLSLITLPCHVGAQVGLHGSVSAPVVPPRVHVVPRQLRVGPTHINQFFAIFFAFKLLKNT